MRGPMNEVFPYVLEQERDLLPKEQTTFWLRVVTAGESASSLKSYSKAFITKGNKQEVDEARYKQAYRSEFLSVVTKVENYQFGYKYAEWSAMGYITFDDPDKIAALWDELPDSVVREVIEAAKGKVEVEELDSKKSQSPSSTGSGKRQS